MADELNPETVRAYIEVALNPYGAWQDIQAQAKEIERLRKQVKAADQLADRLDFVGLTEGLDCIMGPLLDAYRATKERT